MAGSNKETTIFKSCVIADCSGGLKIDDPSAEVILDDFESINNQEHFDIPRIAKLDAKNIRIRDSSRLSKENQTERETRVKSSGRSLRKYVSGWNPKK